MNREILFKAKRIDNEEWLEGFVYKSYGCRNGNRHDVYFIHVYEEDEHYEVDRSTVCSDTGVTDKNGKKIWKNDIVDFLGNKGIIKYNCGCFGIAFMEYIDWEEIEANIYPVTGCDNLLHACKNDNFISLWEIMWNFNDEENSVYTLDVVGNIFDNPEFLEGGAEE